MANPYHDENGRFCSKGEMRAAVNRLASGNNLDAYFTLRSEFEASSGESLNATPKLETPSVADTSTRKVEVEDSRVSLKASDPASEKELDRITQYSEVNDFVHQVQSRGRVITRGDLFVLSEAIDDVSAEGYRHGDTLEREGHFDSKYSVTNKAEQTASILNCNTPEDASINEGIEAMLSQRYNQAQHEGGWDY